ncbi:MAG: hypothetical protein JWM91_3470 [Rhodospirillales bacterium]|nr:hypothetical protein [Rhodospirillales bacterium]
MAAPEHSSASIFPPTALFLQDMCNWQRTLEFEDFVRHSAAAEAAARLMGSRPTQFFHDRVLAKEAGSSIVTPWHRDTPYDCVGGEKTVSYWIALDPVPRATSLRCVAGSTPWSINLRPKRFDSADLYEGDVPWRGRQCRSANRRRIRSIRWVGDAAVFVDRQGKGSPPFKDLTFKHGEPLSGPISH